MVFFWLCELCSGGRAVLAGSLNQLCSRRWRCQSLGMTGCSQLVGEIKAHLFKAAVQEKHMWGTLRTSEAARLCVQNPLFCLDVCTPLFAFPTCIGFSKAPAREPCMVSRRLFVKSKWPNVKVSPLTRWLTAWGISFICLFIWSIFKGRSCSRASAHVSAWTVFARPNVRAPRCTGQSARSYLLSPEDTSRRRGFHNISHTCTSRAVRPEDTAAFSWRPSSYLRTLQFYD